MIFFVTMIVFSPITSIIPGIYATYLMFKNKGKIEIVYNNEDELNEILSMIMDEE